MYQLPPSLAGARGAPRGPMWNLMAATALARRAGPRAAPRAPARTRFQVRFWGPLRNGAHLHTRAAPTTPMAGVPGGARPWRRGAGGFIWVQMTQTYDVAMLKDVADASDIVADAPSLYYSRDAGFTPVADWSDSLFNDVRVRAYWIILNQSKSIFAISVGAVSAVPAAGAYASSIGNGALAPSIVTPSAFLMIRRGALVSAAVGDDALNEGWTSVRRCAADWFLARYGADIAAAQAGVHPVSGKPTQRRFITPGGNRVFVPTLDGIHRFCYNGAPYTGGDLLLTLGHLRALFTAIQTRLVVIGPGDVRLRGVEVAASRLRVGAVVVKGGHLWPVSPSDAARLWQTQGARPADLAEIYDTPLARSDPDVLYESGAALPILPPDGGLRPPRANPRIGASTAPAWLDSIAELLDAHLGVANPLKYRGRAAETRDVFTGPFDVLHVFWMLRARGIGSAPVLRDGALRALTVRVAVEPGDPGRRADGRGVMLSSASALARRKRGRGGGGSGFGGGVMTDADREAARAARLADVTASMVTLAALPLPRGEVRAVSEITTRAQYEASVTATAELDAALFTSASVSSYASDDVRAILALPGVCVAGNGRYDDEAAMAARIRRRGPGARGGGEDDDGVLPPPATVAIDQNLAYTAALYRTTSEGVPSFNAWDVKRRYRPGEATQLHAMYVIEARPEPFSPLWVLLPFEVCRLSGAELTVAMEDPQFARTCRVRYVLEPSRVIASRVPEVIDALWTRLPRPARRDVVNFAVGRAGRRVAVAEQTDAFDTQEEARLWLQQPAVDGVLRSDPLPLYNPTVRSAAEAETEASPAHTEVRLYGAEEEEAEQLAPLPPPIYATLPPVWIVTSRAETELTSGFLAVHARVLDRARYVLYLEARRRAAEGRELLGVKTDALFYTRLPDEADVPKTDVQEDVVRGAFSVSAGVPPASARTPDSASPAWALRAHEERARLFAAALEPPPSVPFVVHNSLDETTNDAVFALLDAGPVHMRAYYPGCGKSTYLRLWAAARGHRILFATFTNALVQAFRRDEVDAVTVHKFLGLSGLAGDADSAVGSSDGLSFLPAARRFDADAYDVVVLDEAALLSPAVLRAFLSRAEAAAARRATAADPSTHVPGGWRLYLTSDVMQIPPIADSPRRSDYADMEYTTSILRRMVATEIHLRTVRRTASAADTALLIRIVDMMWGTPAMRDAGEEVQWTAELRDAVLALLRPLPPRNWPPGLRAVTHRRATADAWATLLAPTLADAARAPPAVNAENVLSWPVRPPPHARTDVVVGQVLRCTARYAAPATPTGSVLFLPHVEYVVTAVDDAETGGVSVTPLYADDTWRPRSARKPAAAEGAEGAEAEAAEAADAPEAFLDDDEDDGGEGRPFWTAVVPRTLTFLTPTGAMTAHSLQGTSLSFPVVVDVGDMRLLPLRSSRQIMMTALSRARDLRLLFAASAADFM